MAITKMAIERASQVMNDKIREREHAWIKKHPMVVKSLTKKERAEIAVKDPAWLKLVIERAGGRYDGSMGLCEYQLASDSPMVAAAVKKTEAANEDRTMELNDYVVCLRQKQNEIITEASLGMLTPKQLLDRCNGF